MTPSQKIALAISETKTKLSDLVALETRSTEQDSELEQLTNKMKSLELEARAALTLEPDFIETVTEGTPEERELKALAEKANMAKIYESVLEHRSTDGAEREIQQAYDLGVNQIPLAMLEERAITPAPSNVGRQQQTIIPGVFPQSCHAFLDIPTPRVGVGEPVFPVLTTNAAVESLAESASGTETTGSFSADVLSPGRLQASFFYSREDRAKFAGMDESLRMNLSEALMDALDKEILAGTNGLFTGTNLANNASTAEADFAAYLSSAYGRVDGTFANDTSQLKMVVGGATYAHMGAAYRNASVDRNAIDRLMAITGGVKVSAHVPAVKSKKQNAVIRRGMRRDAVAPIWEGVTLIPDEITKAATGEIVITAVMLHAVKILRAAGFHKQEFQVEK